MSDIIEKEVDIDLDGADDTGTGNISLFPTRGIGTIYTLLISIKTSAGTAYTSFDYEVWDRTYNVSLVEDGTNTIAKDDTVSASDSKIVNKSTSSFGKRVVLNRTSGSQGVVGCSVKGNGGDATSNYTITVKILGVENGW